MKSIAERAHEHSRVGRNNGERNCAMHSYEIGAREQHRIDVKKACEWWESRCDYLGISKYQIELFKKAMEEGV